MGWLQMMCNPIYYKTILALLQQTGQPIYTQHMMPIWNEVYAQTDPWN